MNKDITKYFNLINKLNNIEYKIEELMTIKESYEIKNILNTLRLLIHSNIREINKKHPAKPTIATWADVPEYNGK